ncbi:hypothetical protein K440DRAFT_636767 [Wilcoxina mikolae CBS 423.85]|nr:hypothetical protein K440DRAFT_636767 [Wilcoxina mikolae CBS 423.85]
MATANRQGLIREERENNGCGDYGELKISTGSYYEDFEWTNITSTDQRGVLARCQNNGSVVISDTPNELSLRPSIPKFPGGGGGGGGDGNDGDDGGGGDSVL